MPLGERESLRDRLAALSRRELVALLVLAGLVLAGAGLWYVRSLPQAVQIRATRARPPSTGEPPASPSPSPSPSAILVHVAGAVRRPGVYWFHTGQRVIDAVRAAGGPRKDAFLDGLNLAAPLADAEQILVPTRGSPGSVLPGQVSGSTLSPPGGVPSVPSALVNVNTATEPELESLPRVGPVLAQKIIDYRTTNGPFTSVDQLDDVSGIGPATLAELRPLVTV